MELPLVLGIVGGRDPAEAQAPGLEEAIGGLVNDLRARFPGAPWLVVSDRNTALEERAARACDRMGLRAVTPSERTGAARVSDDSHVLVTLGHDEALERLALSRLAAAGQPGKRASLDPQTQGPVVRLAPATGGWSATWLDPEGDTSPPRSRLAYEKIWRHVEAFNADAKKALREGAEPLLSAAEAPALSPDLLDFDEAYRVADALARRFQERSQRALGLLLVLAIVATFLLQAGSLAHTSKILSGSLYVACLAGAWVVFLVAKRRDLRTKYLDYRALAEGLRVQFFWRVAGLSASASDHYLRKQRGELDWIRHALRAVEIQNPPTGAPPDLPAARSRWLESQARYFSAAARGHDSKDRRFRRLSAILFVIALALAFLKPFLDSAHPLVMLVGLCPLTAAFVKWWSERRAFGPLAHQYERMAILFDAASRQGLAALESGALEDARAILLEAGREALAENGDWVLLHRERPVRVPGV